MDCIFCRIINNDVPAHRVYEDEFTLAFLDAAPNTPGHTLVIPKEHHRDIYEMPSGVLHNLISAVQRVAQRVKDGTTADGINIAMNNESASGQDVFHAHIHIIPRTEGDGLTHWPHTQVSDEEMERLADAIRAAF